MQRAGLSLILFVLSPAMVVYSQSNTPPKQATDITTADVQEVLKHAPPAVDQNLKIVDIGKLNLAVGVIHRGPTKDSDDGIVHGIAHHEETETYIILSGSGTLVTGGTIIDASEAPKDGDVVKILNGPSVSGAVKDGYYARVVGPGDIVIIPPDVFHGWIKVTDHVDYLSVRPDPDKVLPAGYVNPALKK